MCFCFCSIEAGKGVVSLCINWFARMARVANSLPFLNIENTTPQAGLYLLLKVITPRLMVVPLCRIYITCYRIRRRRSEARQDQGPESHHLNGTPAEVRFSNLL